MNIYKYIYIPIYLLVFFLLTSCDEHEKIDPTIHVGYVLCQDFAAMSLEEYKSSNRSDAIGVVFSEKNDVHPTLAVSLKEIRDFQFSDSLYYQGTSCDVMAFDGIANTTSLQNSYDEKTLHGSPLALYVFSTYPNGHSYAIPSVAEMLLLVQSSRHINEILSAVGGDRIKNDSDDCWYWTSTEVASNSGNQAWTVSAVTGSWMQTPKYYSCKSRAIISLNY